VHSSSFRLDRVALYLSGIGAEEYFRGGLGHDSSPDEACGLAETVLEEILGKVAVPPAPLESYAE